MMHYINSGLGNALFIPGTAMNQTSTQPNYNQQQPMQQQGYSGQSPYPVHNSSQDFSQPGYPTQPMNGGQTPYPIQPQGPAHSKPQEPYNPNKCCI